MTSHTNIIAVMAEIIGIIGLGCLVVFAVLHQGYFHFDLLTTVPSEPKPYLPSFLMCVLLGSWTMGGFESSADVSEETINAKRVTPKGIVWAVIASAVIGFAFIVVMTVAIPDLAEVTKASYPLATITSHYLGEGPTNLFLAFALIAMFSCSLVCMTAGSRLLFAMARDKRMIAAPFFSKVSAHHVPKGAIIAITAIGIVFTFMTDSATSLYGACSVLAALYYLITMVSFAFKVKKKLPKTNTFSLGIWHWPVVIIAAAWSLFEIGIMTIPEEFHPVAVATGVVLFVGVILYFIAGRPKSKRSKA